MRPSVTLITLGVSDFARSLTFYKDELGWETTAKPTDPVAFFPLANIIVGLFPRAELAKDAGIENTTPGFSGMTLAHNMRSKEEVDGAFAALKQTTATIVKEPVDAPWGGYSGYFADPDGHLWEIAWNPHWTMDEAGKVTL